MFEKNLDPQRDGYATYDNSGSKSISFAILKFDISMENHTESDIDRGNVNGFASPKYPKRTVEYLTEKCRMKENKMSDNIMKNINF